MNCPLTGICCENVKNLLIKEVNQKKEESFMVCSRCMNDYVNSPETKDEILLICSHYVSSSPKSKTELLKEKIQLAIRGKDYDTANNLIKELRILNKK